MRFRHRLPPNGVPPHGDMPVDLPAWSDASPHVAGGRGAVGPSRVCALGRALRLDSGAFASAIVAIAVALAQGKVDTRPSAKMPEPTLYQSATFCKAINSFHEPIGLSDVFAWVGACQ